MEKDYTKLDNQRMYKAMKAAQKDAEEFLTTDPSYEAMQRRLSQILSGEYDIEVVIDRHEE